MQVREGYKQTEVGVIPEDWDVVSIGSLGTFSKGQGVRKDESVSGEIPCVRYGEIYTHHSDIVRAFNSFISVSVAKSSKRLKNGDLLFAGSGETKEEIGKCVVFVEDIEAYAGGDIVILSPIKGDSLFFGYLFNTPTIVRQKASKGQGDAVVHISATALSSIKTPLPPSNAEQRAIAIALSDVDMLLAAQDKLIAKKRNIKQAAMQQLLTGKQRLPGFIGEWEVKRLGDLCEKITTGKLDANAMVESGEYPFFTCAKEHYWIDKHAFDVEALLVSGNGANVGYVHYYHGKFNAYQRTYVLSGFSSNIQFMKLFMERNLQDRIRVEVNAGNTPYIVMGTLTDMLVSLPVNFEEQIAIATVLSDMDAELTALEQQRDKTRAIKQGMMQELLTGRIRLV